jgi:hypothetical protein
VSDKGEGALEEHVLRVRLGHGANCSSMGSVVDTLFATAVVGAAVFAAVVTALHSEGVRVAGRADETRRARKGAVDSDPGTGERGQDPP